MLLVAVAIAVGVLESFPTLKRPPRAPTRAELRDALASCGIPDNRISIRTDRDLQGPAAQIGRADVRIAPDDVKCLTRASLERRFSLFFRNRAAEDVHIAAATELAEAMSVEQGRAWLGKRDMLDAMPLPETIRPLSAYAEAVEAFCGAPKNRLLTITEDGFIMLHEEKAFDAEFECVVNALMAASPRQHGISLRFTGYVRESETGEISESVR